MFDLTKTSPKSVRYIKLGSATGRQTDDCLKKDHDAFVHFGTSNPEAFALARAGRWDEFRALRLAREMSRVERHEIKRSAAESNATSASNQVRAFVEDDGTTLWFTFSDGQLYWAFLSPILPEKADPERGFVRKVQGEWSNADVHGKQNLHFDSLSGRLTRTAAYRSTTCSVTDEAGEYLIRRLRGGEAGVVTTAREARAELVTGLVAVIEKFTFKDFELLAEFVLTSVGWRRLSSTGSAMEFVDVVLEQPLDGRVIGAQVKSVFKPSDFEEYGTKFQKYSHAVGGKYHQLYFIYHTDPKNLAGDMPEQRGVELMGPTEIADLAIRAGLADWVIDRIV